MSAPDASAASNPPAKFGTHILRYVALSAQTLGWKPDDFWQATPADLATALHNPSAPQAMPFQRADFARLDPHISL